MSRLVAALHAHCAQSLAVSSACLGDERDAPHRTHRVLPSPPAPTRNSPVQRSALRRRVAVWHHHQAHASPGPRCRTRPAQQLEARRRKGSCCAYDRCVPLLLLDKLRAHHPCQPLHQRGVPRHSHERRRLSRRELVPARPLRPSCSVPGVGCPASCRPPRTAISANPRPIEPTRGPSRAAARARLACPRPSARLLTLGLPLPEVSEPQRREQSALAGDQRCLGRARRWLGFPRGAPRTMPGLAAARNQGAGWRRRRRSPR